MIPTRGSTNVNNQPVGNDVITFGSATPKLMSR
jgi:hypothetical protein